MIIGEDTDQLAYSVKGVCYAFSSFEDMARINLTTGNNALIVRDWKENAMTRKATSWEKGAPPQDHVQDQDISDDEADSSSEDSEAQVGAKRLRPTRDVARDNAWIASVLGMILNKHSTLGLYFFLCTLGVDYFNGVPQVGFAKAPKFFSLGVERAGGSLELTIGCVKDYLGVEHAPLSEKMFRALLAMTFPLIFSSIEKKTIRISTISELQIPQDRQTQKALSVTGKILSAEKSIQLSKYEIAPLRFNMKTRPALDAAGVVEAAKDRAFTSRTISGELRAFEAAATAILNNERDVYKIPGLCFGKDLLKKPQATWTIHEVRWFLIIHRLPATGAEEKLREHVKSLLETLDNEQESSFLIRSASELNLHNKLVALKLVDSPELPDVDDEGWSVPTNIPRELAEKLPEFSLDEVKRENARLHNTINALTKASHCVDSRADAIISSLRYLIQNGKIYILFGCPASMKTNTYQCMVWYTYTGSVTGANVRATASYLGSKCACVAGARYCHHAMALGLTLAQLTKLSVTEIPQGWGSVKAKNGSVLDGMTPLALMPTSWSQNAREAKDLTPEKKRTDKARKNDQNILVVNPTPRLTQKLLDHLMHPSLLKYAVVAPE